MAPPIASQYGRAAGLFHTPGIHLAGEIRGKAPTNAYLFQGATFIKLNLSALFILSALTLSLNACSDDDGNHEEEKTPCTQDVCSSDSILIQCNNGVENPVTCQYGCENNACKPAPSEPGCSYTEPKCSADFKSVLTCTGGVESSKECKNGCENNECKPECTANKCSDDGKTLIKCNDGAESSESCVNGCENNACKAPCDYTDNKCNDDKTAVLSCNAGKENVTSCEKGCENGSCLDCTEATEATDCGAGQICENGACVAGCTADKCDGDNLLACKDARYEAASEANKCANKCIDDAMGDGKSICVDADYCKVAEDCAGREDGKTTCDTSNHKCESFACSKVNCKEGETCVLGACVLDKDLTAESKSECDPATFVDHCRGDYLAFCEYTDKVGETKIYKVKLTNCVDASYKLNGCASYKDGTEVKTSCIESRSNEVLCGTSNSGSECVERYSGAEYTH